MTLTTKIIHLIDKLKIEKLFIEEDKKVSVKFLSFNPKRLEKAIDQLLATNGRFYHMNEFEKEILKELEHRNA